LKPLRTLGKIRLSPGVTRRRSYTSGATLVELMITLGISMMVGLSVVMALIQGMQIIRANETEMWARERGTRVIRRMYNDITKASRIRIYPSYTAIMGAESSYGSCVVLDLPDTGATVAYYLVGGVNTDGSGSIFFDSNAASAPTPLADRLVKVNVLDLEFRRNLNGTVRIGFEVGFIGYPRRRFGSVEADRVRFTTSVTRRNL
jgi:hypothetical protein